jgi:hypothetical protein
MKKPKQKIELLNRSMHNTLKNTKNIKFHQNALWNCARNCPLFLKTRQHVDGKLVKRVNLPFSKHTINTLLSSAASSALTSIDRTSGLLRLHVDQEDKRAPLLPAISSGASMMLQAAVISYLQEAFFHATSLKTACAKHKKVTKLSASIGTQRVNNKLNVATNLFPSSIC